MNVNHSEPPSSAVYKGIMHEVDAANRAGLAIESIALDEEEGAYLAGAFVVATENCRSCNASGIAWCESDEEDES